MLITRKQLTLAPWRLFWLALMAWATYVLARQLVMAMSPVWDWPSYLRQDLLITPLRVATAVLCWWLGRQAFDSARFWNEPGRTSLAWGLGIALTIIYTLSWFSRASLPLAGNWPLRGSELVINFIVAANEELGWRGALWLGLEAWLGGRWALWGTSVLFTVMHLGYQPWQTLPRIFATALVLGMARQRGVSLAQLIWVHFAIDASNALYLPTGLANGAELDMLSTTLVYLIVAWLYWGPQRLKGSLK